MFFYYFCSKILAMASTTFNFELASKPNKTGKYPIFLRITQNRKPVRIKTSVELEHKSDWNPKRKEVRLSEPNAIKWNAILAKELEAAKDKYRELKETSTATSLKIKEKIKSGETSKSFLQYARHRTQELYDNGNIRNYKKYNGFCNKLEKYQTDTHGVVRDLLFSEIDTSFLAKFETYLHTLRNEREPEKVLHVNTIQVCFNVFRAILRRAIEVDNMMPMEKNPFLTFKIKGIKTEKEKLDADEINRIKNLDLPQGSLIWNCRNYFLFSFYCAGIRVGDFIQLRWVNISNDGRIHYQMGKNHKVRDLILVEPAKQILEFYSHPKVKPTDYIFPILDPNADYAKAITQEEKDVLPSDVKEILFAQIGAKTALINKTLKKIASLAGIEKKLSFHISRHSFAKAAKQKGIDNAKVKDLLAHHSLKTTEGYMGNFDTAENDAALSSIFEEKPSVDIDTLVAQLKSLSKKQLKEVLKRVKA